MRMRAVSLGLLALALAAATPGYAQLARTNAIWARKAPNGSITLDGNLNEAVWAQAESWRVHYHYDQSTPVFGTQGIPGSGWKNEGGFPPGTNGVTTNDSTNATLRFLVVGNKLYLGATVPDKSIGGGGQFNYLDGFLMALKDHAAPGFPKPVSEYLYSWWYPRQMDLASPCSQAIDSAVGNLPIFKGRWAPDPVCGPDSLPRARSAEQVAAWNAVTIVNGITNSDAHGTDVSWTVEMMFDLGVMGYDVTDSDGDIIEWNLSIYDTDNWWKLPLGIDLSRNRTWWAGPWGNVAQQDEVRIYARLDVTTSSGALPPIAPDFTIPNAGSAVAPVIDGTITEPVWSSAQSFELRWGDDPLRASYQGIGRWRSGQYQPNVGGGQAFIADRGDATIKSIVKGDWLYMGFDVRDQFVQHYTLEDRWDGITVSITDRAEMDPEDHNLDGKALTFTVGPTGTAITQKDLGPLVIGGNAEVAIALKPGTAVDTTGTVGGNCNNGPQIDTGYTAELAVNLTALGYPAGLGDRTMFLGVTLHDGDSFCNNPDSYATRTWWYREREEECCPAWTLIDGGTVSVGSDALMSSNGFAALGNAPNPFRLFTSLEFVLGRESDVALEVFDLNGRIVTRQSLGRFAAGRQKAPVRLPAGRSGLYLYRLKAQDPATGASLASLSGKMMQLK